MCVPREAAGILLRFIWLMRMLRLKEPLAACRHIGWDVCQLVDLVGRCEVGDRYMLVWKREE